MKGKRKSALKIESNVQVIGTEGSIPKHSVVRDISVREMIQVGHSSLGVINSLHVKFLSGDNLVASNSLMSPVCIAIR